MKHARRMALALVLALSLVGLAKVASADFPGTPGKSPIQKAGATSTYSPQGTVCAIDPTGDPKKNYTLVDESSSVKVVAYGTVSIGWQEIPIVSLSVQKMTENGWTSGCGIKAALFSTKGPAEALKIMALFAGAQGIDDVTSVSTMSIAEMKVRANSGQLMGPVEIVLDGLAEKGVPVIENLIAD